MVGALTAGVLILAVIAWRRGRRLLALRARVECMAAEIETLRAALPAVADTPAIAASLESVAEMVDEVGLAVAGLADVHGLVARVARLEASHAKLQALVARANLREN